MKRQRKRFGFLFFSMICTLCVLSAYFLLYREQEAGGERTIVKLFPMVLYRHEKKAATIDDSKIRVLIKTGNFTSFYHQKIQITSDASFVVREDGKEKKYHAGEKAVFSFQKLYSEISGKKPVKKSVRISSLGKARLRVLSFQRMGHCPAYRGELQIQAKKRGLLLVNELSFREYLYAVVPSEISSSAPIEALKAQAVCARTYAANRQKAHEYEKYGADLDDSDTCQVYNNVPEDFNSRKAVDETEGLVLKKDGKKIPVYYFSTSWGYTASGKEVWNTEEQIPYLKRKFQITENCEKNIGTYEEPDLSGENAFRLFLDKEEYQDRTLGKNCPFETYDSKSAWYRWKLEISWEMLEERLRGKISACYQAYPNLVLFRKRGEKSFKKGVFCEIGSLKKIYPGKRDPSGLVTELIVEGSKCSVKIKTQYSIRRLLSFSDEDHPKGDGFLDKEKIVRMDGSECSMFKLLPSAAFYLEKRERKGLGYLFIKGGGFGHGTGMSQYGAEAQAAAGWSCEKILSYYFSGISIEKEAAIY